jgi:hypothetical protein
VASAAGVAAVASVVAAVLVTADPAAAPGYATWSAVPETAPGGSATSEDLEEWASACTDLTGGGVAIEGVGARKGDVATRTPLVDRRGDHLFCVDVSMGSGTAADPFIALSGLSGGSLSQAAVNTRPERVAAPAAGDVVLVAGAEGPPPAREPGVESTYAYQAFGLAGPDVTGVDVVLADGLRITATLQHGLWGAWWPEDRGDPAGSLLEIRTATGTRTVTTDEVRLR